jgi:signal transduction histidine kinase/ligand-binding sensor domain-containing protein/CheY-like chemotaxis protein
LGNLSVTSLVQDKTGYIWVGTENGLYRFDGAKFRQFGGNEGISGSTYISALHVDDTGRLWVGTVDGLFEMKDQHFVQVFSGTDKLPVWAGQRIRSLKSGHVLVNSKFELFIVESKDQGETWAARIFFTQQQRQAHSELSKIVSVETGPDGDIWVGCRNKLCRSRNNDVQLFDSSSGLLPEFWKGLLVDHEGKLWARSTHHLMSLTPGDNRFADRTTGKVDPQLEEIHQPVIEDQDGRLVTIGDYGIIRRGPNGWQKLNNKNGLDTDSGVAALLVDKDGDLWMGTGGHGLIHWTGYSAWENWKSDQGLPNNDVWSFLKTDDGIMLIGTSKGSAAFDQNAGSFKSQPGDFQGASNPWSSFVQDRAGNIWSGTFAGTIIRRAAHSGKTTTISGLPLIFRLLIDTTGRLWICTQEGLYLIEKPELGLSPVRVDEFSGLIGQSNVEIFGACQTQTGTLWFSTTQGLLTLSGGHWNTPRLPPSSRYRFESIECEDDHSIWLSDSPGSGFWHATGNTEAMNLTKQSVPGRESGIVMSLHVDKRHWLWVGMDSGVAVWNGKKWELLNQQSGLIWNDLNQHALYEDRDGTIWIGTSNGASHVKRPESLFNDTPMEIVIEGIARNSIPIKSKGPFTVPWDTSSLTFTLAVLKFRNHEAVSFRYRLKGLEDAWSKTDNTELRYPALDPGHYVLQVIADDSATQNSSAMKEIDFDIAPLWWQTRYFYAGCGLMIVLLFIVTYRRRVRKLLRRQKQMEQLVLKNQDKSKFLADAAHDLRQPMQAISNLLEAAQHALSREDLPKSLELIDFAKMAAQSMRSSFDSVLEISRLESGLVAAEYSPFDLNEMVVQITHLLKPLADERSVSIRKNIKERIHRFVYSDKQLLSRVLYNLLSNAIKYSDPAKGTRATVIVSVVSLQDFFRIDILDNGIGIPEAQMNNIFKPFFQIHNPERDRGKGLGLGLSIVHAILGLMEKHRITMRSAEGAGTRFSLYVPKIEISPHARLDRDADHTLPADCKLSGIYVLYVEDDILVRTATEALFREYGILFEAVRSLHELEMKLPALERMPDLILTDYSLTGNHSAIDVVQAVALVFETEIPTIVLTGESENIQAMAGLESAIILRKPVSPTVLLEKMFKSVS